MKGKGLKIWIMILGAFAVFMIFSVIRLKAQDSADLLSCNGQTLDPSSIYANPDLDVEGLMSLYHQTMNEKFNAYIKDMIAAKPTDPPNPKSVSPAMTDASPPEPKNGVDPITGIPKDCGNHNFTTYCVGATLLTDPQFGYMAYRQALTCRRNKIFNNAKDISDFKSYNDVAVVGDKNQKQSADNYLASRLFIVSGQTSAIDREVDAAKKALDQTLSAYNQLRTAWAMHKKYKEIYKQLGQYRNKLVEVRHQIEQFPGKFIDVTTTSCV